MEWEIYHPDTRADFFVMKFEPLKLQGAWQIEQERLEDERGFFARYFCEKEFSERGLNCIWAQNSVSFNFLKGTLRGMHYQAGSHAEIKLVRCTRGAIYDVILDLREGSKTFRKWAAAELSPENGRLLYIPEGFAHGFLTLQPDTEVMYQISTHFDPAASRGVRWNDPEFEIRWPGKVECISDRDANYEMISQ